MRRLALGILVVVTAAGLVLAAVVFRQARTVQSHLTDARERLNAAEGLLEESDLPRVRSELDRAAFEVDAAAAAASGGIWRTASSLPLLGTPLVATTEIVDVADAGLDLATSLLSVAERLVPVNSESASSGALDGGVDVAAFEEVGDVVATSDLERLEREVRDLRAVSLRWAPGAVHEARTDALDYGSRLAGVARDLRSLSSVMPGFLGADGERSYFLAMQNNAELRGTGGLIGFFAILTVEDGRLRLSEPETYDVLEDVTLEEDERTAVVTADFLERYGHVDAASFLGNVNVDPDLPTTAPVLLALYERARGTELDGVVMIDPFGLESLLASVGPVDLDPELVPADASIPNPVPPDRLAAVALEEAYRVFGGDTPERDAFLSALAQAAFETVFDGDWEIVPLMGDLGRALRGRHVQVYSGRAPEQDVFERLDAAGKLGTTGDTTGAGDLLAVTANNAAANKLDYYVRHDLTVDVVLHEPPEMTEVVTLDREASVRFDITNPVKPGAGDTYVFGSAPATGEWLGQVGPWGLSRTWLTFWAPASAWVLSGERSDGGDPEVRVGSIHGHTAVDHYLEVPAQTEAGVQITLLGPVTLAEEAGEYVYDLTLWRQAKAMPDRLDARIAAPDGWHITDLEVGGGRAERDGGLDTSYTVEEARVSGEMTADLRLVLRMRPSTR